MSDPIPPNTGADGAAGHAANNMSAAGAGFLPDSDPQLGSADGSCAAPALSEATLRQLERICERLGADPQRSPQMARQLVKRAGQLARERDWSEAQALEHLLSLLLKASAGGDGLQPSQ